jgi:selT/selW/selH-like putative selenoprotein
MMTVMSSATVKLQVHVSAYANFKLANMLLVFQVQYCGGCGFERYYSDLKGALEREFPGQVEVISVKDEDMTGNFEITLMGTNQLIHSKTKKGMGKCESSEERQKLFAIVKLYLDFLSKKSAI